MKKLEIRIKKLSDQQIIACLVTLPNDLMEMSREQNLVRLKLLSEYENRNGLEKVDLLMDKLEELPPRSVTWELEVGA
tara:strand:- start:9782 stop:10015 length:234 start_codon:yes stop_codon:yes gene_type:complete